MANEDKHGPDYLSLPKLNHSNQQSTVSPSISTEESSLGTLVEENLCLNDTKPNGHSEKGSTLKSTKGDSIDIGDLSKIQNIDINKIRKQKQHAAVKRNIIESFIFVLLIAVIIGLFLVPIVLFYSRPEPNDAVNTTAYGSTMDESIANCSNVINISEVCDFMNISSLKMFSSFDEAEERLLLLHSAASDECQPDLVSFSCHAVYSSTCDDNETVMSLSDQCNMAKQGACMREWNELEAILPTLMNCDSYGVTCGEEFGLFKNECLLLCGEFSQYDDATDTAILLTRGVSTSIGNIIGGIAVFAIAFFKYKSVFQFPQVLILYSTGVLFFSGTVILISSFASSDLFCSDRFLTPSLDESTVYCQFEGLSEVAGLFIFCEFWLLFLIHLFIKIVFPLFAARLYNYHHRFVLYTIEVIVLISIPIIIGFTIIGTSGFHIASFPPRQCSPNEDVTFYTLILPTLIMGTVGVCLLVCTFMSIHRKNGIFKQQHSRETCIEFTIPEIKLLIVFFYFTIVLVLYFADFSLQIRNRNELSQAVARYAACGQSGMRDCHEERKAIEQVTTPVLTIIVGILASFVNTSNILFVLQFKEVRHGIRRLSRRITGSKLELPSKNSA